MPRLLELPTDIWLQIWKEVYSGVIIYITLDRQTSRLNIDQVCTECINTSTLDPPACKQLRRPNNLLSPLLISQGISRFVRPILYETVEFWFQHVHALISFHEDFVRRKETPLSSIRKIRLYAEVLHSHSRQQICLNVASSLEARRKPHSFAVLAATKKPSWDLAAVMESLDTLKQLHVIMHHENTQLASQVRKLRDAVLAAKRHVRLRITLPVWHRDEKSKREVRLWEYQLNHKAVHFDQASLDWNEWRGVIHAEYRWYQNGYRVRDVRHSCGHQGMTTLQL